MGDTAFFSPDVFVFLRQLKRNNDREWFAKNKARYQTSIVEPALSFITRLCARPERDQPPLRRGCAAYPRFPVSHLSRHSLFT